MGKVAAVDGFAARILLLLGQRVIIDADLAALHDVPAKRLDVQVERDARHLPPGFLFARNATRNAEAVADSNHPEPAMTMAITGWRSDAGLASTPR